jgi:hypothetical protein
MTWTWCRYTRSQLVIGLAACQAVDHDAAGDPLGCGQARLERGAARRLQDHVDARAAGQPEDLRGDVGPARVEDVVGARAPHRLVLVGEMRSR